MLSRVSSFAYTSYDSSTFLCTLVGLDCSVERCLKRRVRAFQFGLLRLWQLQQPKKGALKEETLLARWITRVGGEPHTNKICIFSKGSSDRLADRRNTRENCGLFNQNVQKCLVDPTKLDRSRLLAFKVVQSYY
jgi:hypothetical protein